MMSESDIKMYIPNIWKLSCCCANIPFNIFNIRWYFTADYIVVMLHFFDGVFVFGLVFLFFFLFTLVNFRFYWFGVVWYLIECLSTFSPTSISSTMVRMVGMCALNGTWLYVCNTNADKKNSSESHE